MIVSPTPGTAQRAGRLPGLTAVEPGSRADLLRRVHQALQLTGHAMHAAVLQDEQDRKPPQAPSAAPPGPDGVRPLVLAKVMAEAAMLMRCAGFLRDEDASVAVAIDRLARQVAPHARSEAVLARLCQEPYRAIEHAAAHVYLCDIGHGDDAFDRFLQELLDAEPIGGAERLPNHALECHWLGQVRTRMAGAADIDAALLARTCVALPLDVLASSTLDLYAFTHVVLYASDMGGRAVAWPRAVDEIAAEAEAALAAALDADNFDLAAELLWTWPMLGLCWSPAARFAFEVLAAAQDEHGFLPGPQYSPPQPGAPPAAAHDDFVLRTSYHATLAMGMLCAAALRPGRAPVPPPAGATAAAACVDRLLPLLPAVPRTPRWLDAQAGLERGRRRQLAPFVLTLVFRRAAAAHDLPRLRDGLAAALGCDLTAGPAVRQALSLLRRATALAGLRCQGDKPAEVAGRR